MRRAALILAGLILAGIGLRAQTPKDYNFSTDGTTITWQRVFQASDTCIVAVIRQNLAARGFAKDIAEDVPGTISMEIAFRAFDTMEEIGYSRFDLPLYAGSGHFTAHAVLQVKPDRYRVTVTGWEVFVRNIGTVRLEGSALRRGAFHKNFYPGAADVIDYHLGTLFGGLDIPALDDEW